MQLGRRILALAWLRAAITGTSGVRSPETTLGRSQVGQKGEAHPLMRIPESSFDGHSEDQDAHRDCYRPSKRKPLGLPLVRYYTAFDALGDVRTEADPF